MTDPICNVTTPVFDMEKVNRQNAQTLNPAVVVDVLMIVEEHKKRKEADDLMLALLAIISLQLKFHPYRSLTLCLWIRISSLNISPKCLFWSHAQQRVATQRSTHAVKKYELKFHFYTKVVFICDLFCRQRQLFFTASSEVDSKLIQS